MKVVSSAKISERHQIELKDKYNDCDFYFFENMAGALEELKTAEVLITYGEDLTAAIIMNTQKLSWIQVISSGVDKLPFDAIKERRITVTNARGIHALPMSEYTFAAILQLARKSNEVLLNQLNKKWDRTIRFSEINGLTIGIIGLGAIGQAIANKAKAFNMRVIGSNSDGRVIPNVDKVYKADQISNLLAESDYVILILPLTDKTYHLIGRDELNLMKETSYLINIARGEIIDEEALVESLRNKQIAGAVLDVFSKEPLPEDHPFWELDNCIITPHLSGRSPKYMERALEIFKLNMNKLKEKNLDFKNIVDLRKKY